VEVADPRDVGEEESEGGGEGGIDGHVHAGTEGILDLPFFASELTVSLARRKT